MLHVPVGGVVPLVDTWYSVTVEDIPLPVFPCFPCSPIFPTEYEVDDFPSVYVIKVLVHRYWPAATLGTPELHDPVGGVVPLVEA